MKILALIVKFNTKAQLVFYFNLFKWQTSICVGNTEYMLAYVWIIDTSDVLHPSE